MMKVIQIKVGRDKYTFNLSYDKNTGHFSYTLLDFELTDFIRRFSNKKVKVIRTKVIKDKVTHGDKQ